MKSALPIAVLLIIIGMSGCIRPCQHLRSVEEAETNLDLVRIRKNALEQEAKSLRDLNEKLITHSDSVSTELQDLRERRGLEHDRLQATIQEPAPLNMEEKVKDLNAQNIALQDRYTELKNQHQTLKAALLHYQKELKELQQIPTFTDADLKRYR